MISLNTFVNKWKGKRADVPWGFRGQCVSLVQRYLNECLGYEMHPRGNAKAWVDTLKNEGIARAVSGPAQAGDIIVYGSAYGGGYGHIAVALGNGKMFDQNNTSHDNGAAGITNIFGSYTIMRPYKKPPVDNPGEAVDQILHKGSKVKFDGVFTVNRINAKNNTFCSYQLIGGNPTKDYHWIPSGPFVEVAGGNNKVDQVLYVGSKVRNDNTYIVQQTDIPTDSAKLVINGRTVWIKCSCLREI